MHLFSFLCVKLQLPKKGPTREKKYFPILAGNIFHHLKCCPIFPFICAGFSSICQAVHGSVVQKGISSAVSLFTGRAAQQKCICSLKQWLLRTWHLQGVCLGMEHYLGSSLVSCMTSYHELTCTGVLLECISHLASNPALSKSKPKPSKWGKLEDFFLGQALSHLKH